MRRLQEIEDELPDYFSYEKNLPEQLEPACFGMGCFWGVETLFASVEGVYITRSGYTGGEKDEPTYNSLGNHTESVHMLYDPEEVSYGELLEIFWNNHDYSTHRKHQYASRIFPASDSQKQEADRSLAEHAGATTMIQELETFWIAEDYHQKYRLRSFEKLMQLFEYHTPEEFINSPLAASLNALADGRDLPISALQLDEQREKLVREELG